MSGMIATSQSQKSCIEGKVTDIITGQPIADVHVWDSVRDNGTVTDNSGYFILCDIDPLKAILHFSHTAYSSKDLILQNTLSHPLSITLNRKEIIANEVIIKGSSGGINNPVLPGQAKLHSSDIVNMPTVLGEADVVRALRKLPGIQSVSEGVGGIFVRGAGPGQNMILLDGMELMNPVHLMGVYSVFNPLTIGETKVYKGHSPPSLRGRISSTIEVTSQNPLHQDNKVECSIGNIASNLTLTQKSPNQKWGIITGIRRSYLELQRDAASLILPDESNFFKKTLYSFYDFNGKVTYRPSCTSQFSISWYLGTDRFNLKDKRMDYDAGTNYGNRALAIQWKKRIWENILLTTAFNYTSAWSGFEGNIIGNEVDFKSTHDRFSVKSQILAEKKRHLFRMGIDAYIFSTVPQGIKLDLIEKSFIRKDHFKNADAGFFIEDTYKCSPSLKLQGGIRAHYYLSVNTPKKNTNSYGSGINPEKGTFFWSPSLSMMWQYRPDLSFRMGWSGNVQMVHLASLSSMPLPNDIWMMATSGLAPQKSQQVSVGFYQKLPGFSVSSEIFGKLLQNQIIFNLNVNDNQEEEPFENHFFHGKGKAYGMELSVKKESGKIRGSVNYTLSRSKRSFPEIYQGEWFNDKFDRIHDLSVMSNCKINEQWSIGLSFIFATGNNLTLPTGRMWMAGTVMNDYEGFNNFRMPPYHRLDLSANYNFNCNFFKKSVLNFSLINIYNRSNPYFIYYQIAQGGSRYDIDIKASQVSLFPIMPSVNWRFKF